MDDLGLAWIFVLVLLPTSLTPILFGNQYYFKLNLIVFATLDEERITVIRSLIS